MKRSLFSLWGAAVLAMAGTGAWAMPDINVTAAVEIHDRADFYQPLSSLGRWLEVGQLGRCWHPAGIGATWRPFGNGEWVRTDCDWYWASDEPWAWACYHYGAWMADPDAGWVWVPGVVWSPAWVVWRTGGGFVGWAPRAPAGVEVAPAWFAFVEINHFDEPVRPPRVLPNNAAAFDQTAELHRVRQETRDVGWGRPQRVVIFEGPDAAEVQAATGRKLAVASIKEVVHRMPATRPARPSTQTNYPVEWPSGVPEIPATPQTPLNPETPAAPVSPPPPEAPANPATPAPAVPPYRSLPPQQPAKPTPPTAPTTPF